MAKGIKLQSKLKNYLLLGMFFLIMIIVLIYFLISLGIKKGVNKRKQRKIGL